MLSNPKKQLYISIVNFLASELSNNGYSDDTIESLEVAKQCLESAFHLSDQPDCKADNLLTVYERGLKASLSSPPAPYPAAQTTAEVSPENKAVAESLKTQGNHCMTEEKFHEAVTCYSKAIELDPHNAVYFCNRAAANSRLNNHDESIRDCERAVAIDPNYSKAYGRMGLAYSNKGNIPKAIDCYKKAISLDPNNKNFQENLSIAEARLQDSDAGSGPEVGLGGPGGLNLGALFASPAMQDLARQFVSDPNLQNTVSSMMQGMLGGGVIPGATGGGRAPGNAEPAAHGGSDGPPTANPNIAAAPLDNLLRIGQQFAQQMQQSNPDLVSTLRQRMQDVTGQPPGDGTNDHNSSGN
uniref:Small glutamine-rich tetratricopeptide repeat-containing protein alpha n=1 Tax=Schistocephalus solidus TaxID=70667 RepID=A0A0X3NH89_SCHSO